MLLYQGKVVGPRVHDGRIAALCLVSQSARALVADRDRDFSRFLPCSFAIS